MRANYMEFQINFGRRVHAGFRFLSTSISSFPESSSEMQEKWDGCI
jgi:hypothetical protein